MEVRQGLGIVSQTAATVILSEATAQRSGAVAQSKSLPCAKPKGPLVIGKHRRHRKEFSFAGILHNQYAQR